MPLESTKRTIAGEVLIWDMKEDLKSLTQLMVKEFPSLLVYPEYGSEKRLKEWMACRLLQKHSRIKDKEIVYTPQGKPILSDGQFLSFSHSEHYCVLFVSNNNCGVDIEERRPALEKVKHKFLNEAELLQLPAIETERAEFLQWAWGIKESVLKITGDKNFDYSNKIQIKQIELAQLQAKVAYFVNEVETTVNCHLIKSPHYYLVCVTE